MSDLFQFAVIGMKKLLREDIEKFPISSANYAEVLRKRNRQIKCYKNYPTKFYKLLMIFIPLKFIFL